MSSAVRKRPRIGDVVEISTPRGLAYAQFTHKHVTPPKFGALIRVAPGFTMFALHRFLKLLRCDRNSSRFFHWAQHVTGVW
jgi:hypothetical protein